MDRTSLAITALFCTLLMGCEGLPGPTGEAGPGYATLTDPRIQPVIIFACQSEGSVGPYDTYNQIQIRFNKIMDLSSLRHAIRLSSEDGVSTDTNSFATDGGDLITFSAGDSSGSRAGFRWKVGSVYTMTISSDATDMNGNSLPSFAMSFTPEPVFRVLSVKPRDRQSNVGMKASIQLSFNSPIDTSILGAIAIVPSIGGNWRLNGSTLVRVRASLDVGTEYVLTLPASARDRFGNHLPAAFTSRFTTLPFRISSTIPLNGEIGVPRRTAIRFTLTAPIDTATVRGGFSVSPPVDGQLILFGGAARSFTYVPAGTLESSAHYVATLSSSLRSGSGKLLSAPFSLEFTTGE